MRADYDLWHTGGFRANLAPGFPSKNVFQQDRYRCVQIAKHGASGVGGKMILNNLVPGFDVP